MAAPVSASGVAARLAHGYLLALVVVLGVWTAVYQIALLRDLTRNVAIGIWVGVLAMGLAKQRPLRSASTA